jgi:hypothetical protein
MIHPLHHWKDNPTTDNGESRSHHDQGISERSLPADGLITLTPSFQEAAIKINSGKPASPDHSALSKSEV